VVVVVGETVIEAPPAFGVMGVPPQDVENHSSVPVATLDVNVTLCPKQRIGPPNVASSRLVVIAAGTAGAVVNETSEP
jgi:hypothetical protein